MGDLAAVIFTVTPDLTAAFPAEAERVRLGWHAVPLLCVQEAAVQGALPFCVRVLLLAEFPAERQPAPVYLRQAISYGPTGRKKSRNPGCLSNASCRRGNVGDGHCTKLTIAIDWAGRRR